MRLGIDGRPAALPRYLFLENSARGELWLLENSYVAALFEYPPQDHGVRGPDYEQE